MPTRHADAGGGLADRAHDLLRRAPAHIVHGPTTDAITSAVAHLAPDVQAPAPQSPVRPSCARVFSRDDVGDVVSERGHLDWRRRIDSDVAVAELACLVGSPAPQ